MTTARLFLRVSSPAQKSSGRLERQEEELRKYCKKKKYKVTGIYNEGVCSKNKKEKRAMAKAKEEANDFDKLIAVELDRFGNTALTYDCYMHFRNKDVGLVGIKEKVDSQENYIQFINKLYGLNIEDKDSKRYRLTNAGKERIKEKLLAGESLAFKPIYGIHKDGTLCNNVMYVWWIFQRYLYHHKSVGEIAKTLNEEGIEGKRILSPELKKWTGTTIWNILKNHIYVDKGVIREYAFKRVQKRLKIEKGGAGKYVLSNRVFCGKCKGKMKLRKEKYHCKECRISIERMELEKKVFEEVKNQMSGETLRGYTLYTVCNEKKLEKIGDEWKWDERDRAIRNWIPLEFGKRVVVKAEEGIAVEGLDDQEIKELMEA